MVSTVEWLLVGVVLLVGAITAGWPVIEVGWLCTLDVAGLELWCEPWVGELCCLHGNFLVSGLSDEIEIAVVVFLQLVGQ